MLRSCLLFSVLLLPGTLPADEAIGRDGTRRTGKLTLTPNGRWQFDADGKAVVIDPIERVRFAVDPPEFRVSPLPLQIRLIRGQVINGQILGLDNTHLRVRTAWCESLAVPRPLIERVTHTPRTQPVVFEPFSNDLSGWKLAGEPKIADGRLVLNANAQSLERTLAKAIDAGKLELQIFGQRSRLRRTILTLGFIREGKPFSIQIDLVGPHENWHVTSPDKPKFSGQVRRDNAGHLLSCEFSSTGLNVFVDQGVLWSQADAGTLRSISLSCEGDGNETCRIDDVILVRNTPLAADRSWADLTVDAVRSIDGDETFGTLEKAGSAGVVLRTRIKPIAIPWTELSELTFRRAQFKEHEIRGEHVRVRVGSTGDSVDTLDGVVRSFNERSLLFAHAILGEIRIPRERLKELHPVFHGVAIPLDSTPRHIGHKPAFGYAVVKPETARFQMTIKRNPAAKGFIVIDAARIGPRDVNAEVFLDEVSLGSLNAQSDRSTHEVREFRFPLPEGGKESAKLETAGSRRPIGKKASGNRFAGHPAGNRRTAIGRALAVR